MNQFNFQKYKSRIGIGSLYFFLAAGGLWHILGVFQTLMRLLAAPLVAGLAVLAIWLILRQNKLSHRTGFLIWCAVIFGFSFFIEWLGVHSGVIFGSYAYGQTLQPQFWGVPLVIGCAWLVMLLSTTAVWQHLAPEFLAENIWATSLGISFLMVVFDFFMEQTAPLLDYWYWKNHTVPLQNYVAWFVISFLFIQPALRLKLMPRKMPLTVFHLYWAQLVYFVLVLLRQLNF